MNTSFSIASLAVRPRFRVPAAFLVCAGFALITGSLQAKNPVPENLAGGLDVVVRDRVAFLTQKKSGDKGAFTSSTGARFASQRAADLVTDSITNADGRVMVLVRLNGLAKFRKVRNAVKAGGALGGKLEITAVDPKFNGGVLEGWIDVDDVAELAHTKGVASVTLEAKPEISRSKASAPVTNVVNGQQLTLVGTTFDQGVTQHGVDKISKVYNPAGTIGGVDYSGQGISIGFLSDSYGKVTTITPAQDVTNFDLPGAGNPYNTQPVVLLQEVAATTGTDEGRAMVQIGYKMAPKARLAFASAFNGEVSFANNIRALAGLPGFTFPAATQQGFAASVICDDVGYGDEPFFQDGIISAAVDDVAATGVAYFSSSGNDIGTYDYDSDFRYVPYTGGTTAADSPALVGTNIKLAGVPTNLYQGGFHNFNPAGQDVALKYNLALNTTQLPQTNFQWTDPYNQTLTYNTPAIYTATGNGNAAGVVTPASFTTPSLTAGSNYVIIVSATSGDFDAIVTVRDPNNTVVVDAQDTGSDETINFYPTITGQYTIQIAAYINGATQTAGNFAVNVYTGNNALISTDYNLLTFDLNGNYLSASSLTANNYSNNIPFEFGKTPPLGATTVVAGEGAVQYLVARSSVPTQPQPANHFRILVRGNGLSGIGPAEYVRINTPNTKGHAMANGCNGTASYSVFRPSLPEYSSSPGPATVYFNNVGTRLATPEVRLQPGVAAADGANNSFFASDDVGDLDTKPNFYGTSAAAPHAAAIAALVQQSRGGPTSVTAAQMKNILHTTAFPHDLDPFSATGTAKVTNSAGAGKVTVTVNCDFGLNPNSGAFDPNSISVSYIGAGNLTGLTFNPQGTAATGGNPTGGNNGLTETSSPATYYSNIYPGIVFLPNTIPFTLGTLTGLTAADVGTPVFAAQAPAPSVAGQWWTMGLTFPTANFTGGKVLRFTIGHGLQHNRVVNTANGTAANGGATSTAFVQGDLFGGTVLLPDGTGTGAGMTFSGTTSGGGTFSGTINNRYGSGYSAQDGFGFINAAAACGVQ